MKIDLKAKLIISLIHISYLDCFAVCIFLDFSSAHKVVICSTLFSATPPHSQKPYYTEDRVFINFSCYEVIYVCVKLTTQM